MTLFTADTLAARDRGDTTAQTAPARVRMRHHRPTGTFVDGGWWPRSLDLTVELPGLLNDVWARGYDVFRVTYNLRAWDEAPRRIWVGEHQVKLGGYNTESSASITLVDSTGWRRTELVVVPPDTDAASAEQALTMAAAEGDHHRAAEILESAGAEVNQNQAIFG